MFALARLYVAAAVVASLLVPAARAGVIQGDLPAASLRMTDLGPVAADRPITLLFVLPMRDPDGAERFLGRLYRPGDALFRKFVRPPEFRARFGGRGADAAALARWARSMRLQPGKLSSSGTILPVTGGAAALGRALGIGLRRYRAPDGHEFFAADRAPIVPDALAGKLQSIVGLSNYVRVAPLAIIKPPQVPGLVQGSGPGGAFTARDLREIYRIPDAPRAATQTLAVFEQGGFLAGDIKRYRLANHLPEVPVIVRNVAGWNGGVNGSSVELEAVLDIDMELGINPNASRILVYEDGRDEFTLALLRSLAAMADDGEAEAISVSYGLDEAINGVAVQKAEKPLLMQLAAQGQAVFASAGDLGAYGDTGYAQHQAGEPVTVNVLDPGSQPYVTAVGGTTLFAGRRHTYVTEQAWNEFGVFLGATGGGVSALWPIPRYQAPSLPAANGGSSIYRNVPDVTAVGDPITGVAVYSNLNGGWLTIGGTSVSSPIWAAFYSVLNGVSEALQQGRIGFFNPMLYNATRQAYSYGIVPDVADGTNGNAAIFGIGGYFAGPQYDDGSGLGSIAGGAQIYTFLVRNLRTAHGLEVPGEPVVIAKQPTSIELAWLPSHGAAGYVVTVQGQTLSDINVAVTTAPNAKVLHLLPLNQYTVGVTALSANGKQSAPNPITVTTPKD